MPCIILWVHDISITHPGDSDGAVVIAAWALRRLQYNLLSFDILETNLKNTYSSQIQNKGILYLFSDLLSLIKTKLFFCFTI